jgi:hypothetical protein
MNFDIRLHLRFRFMQNLKFHCDKCDGMDDKKEKIGGK